MKRAVHLAGLALVCGLVCACAQLRQEPELARVKIWTEGADTEIRIDGKPVGSTSFTSIFVELSPGEHTIHVEAAGYEPQEKVIHVLPRGAAGLPGGDQEGGYQQMVRFRMKRDRLEPTSVEAQPAVAPHDGEADKRM